jgi:hypothetical protein
MDGRPATLIGVDFYGVVMRTEMEIRQPLYKDKVPPGWGTSRTRSSSRTHRILDAAV